MNYIIRNFFIAHLLIMLMIFFYYKEITILSYINSSFIVGGLLTLLGLVSFIFSTGFFDVFTISMRKVITSKRRMEDVMSMRPPSKIFTNAVSPILGSGALVLATMGIALIIYYI